MLSWAAPLAPKSSQGHISTGFPAPARKPGFSKNIGISLRPWGQLPHTASRTSLCETSQISVEFAEMEKRELRRLRIPELEGCPGDLLAPLLWTFILQVSICPSPSPPTPWCPSRSMNSANLLECARKGVGSPQSLMVVSGGCIKASSIRLYCQIFHFSHGLVLEWEHYFS